MKIFEVDEQPNNVPLEVEVSVRMTTYQHAAYIAQAIDSVLMQKTDFPFEILIGEDDSTDGTREICMDYAKRYSDKIRLFLRHEKDKIYIYGKKTGKLNGMRTKNACRGKYIAILEGDDFWIDDKKLQKQVDILKKYNDISVVATRALVRHEKSDRRDSIKPALRPGKFGCEFFIRNRSTVNTATLVYRKSDLTHPMIQSTENLLGDWALLVGITNCGKSCLLLSDVTAVYRVHSKGMWSSIDAITEKLKLQMKSLEVYLQYKESSCLKMAHGEKFYLENLLRFYTYKETMSTARFYLAILRSPKLALAYLRRRYRLYRKRWLC